MDSVDVSFILLIRSNGSQLVTVLDLFGSNQFLYCLWAKVKVPAQSPSCLTWTLTSRTVRNTFIFFLSHPIYGTLSWPPELVKPRPEALVRISGSERKWNSLHHVRLWDPIDYTVHGILQARILEWVAFPFSRGSSQLRDQTQVFHIAGGFFTIWVTREAQEYWVGSLSLLQQIFLTQKLNMGLLHCRRILYQLSQNFLES